MEGMAFGRWEWAGEAPPVVAAMDAAADLAARQGRVLLHGGTSDRALDRAGRQPTMLTVWLTLLPGETREEADAACGELARHMAHALGTRKGVRTFMPYRHVGDRFVPEPLWERADAVGCGVSMPESSGPRPRLRLL